MNSDSLYMAIDISSGPSARKYPVERFDSEPVGGWPIEYKTTKILLKRVRACVFDMGYSPSGRVLDDEMFRGNAEHEVKLLKDYYIGVFPITCRQWQLVMGHGQNRVRQEDSDDLRPITNVSYNDIRGKWLGRVWPNSSVADQGTFICRIRQKCGIDELDLPTEAEWENAAGGGIGSHFGVELPCGTTWWSSTGRYAMDDDRNRDFIKGAQEFCWCWDHFAHTGPTSLMQVGQKRPNDWGFYDMCGNVGEWCLDCRDWNRGKESVTDPRGPDNYCYDGNSTRIVKGGAYDLPAIYCSCHARIGRDCQSRESTIGFRLCCHEYEPLKGAKKVERDARMRLNEKSTIFTMMVLFAVFAGVALYGPILTKNLSCGYTVAKFFNPMTPALFWGIVCVYWHRLIARYIVQVVCVHVRGGLVKGILYALVLVIVVTILIMVPQKFPQSWLAESCLFLANIAHDVGSQGLGCIIIAYLIQEKISRKFKSLDAWEIMRVRKGLTVSGSILVFAGITAVVVFVACGSEWFEGSGVGRMCYWIRQVYIWPASLVGKVVTYVFDFFKGMLVDIVNTLIGL